MTPCGVQFRRKATSDEEDSAHVRKDLLEERGVPPWFLLQGELPGTQASIESSQARWKYQYAAHCPSVGSQGDGPRELQAPAKNLRGWADDYCSSKKMLKEFNFHKTVHGWNFGELEEAVHGTVMRNWMRPGNVPTIKVTVQSDVVSIRPDNWLSRMLSRRFVKFLLWVFLVYPLVIWPFKRFGRGGGGEWRVAGAAYALAKWVHLEDSQVGETADQYGQRAPKIPSLRALRTTPRGVSRLEGVREGEWFREWEHTIASCVQQRRISSDPLTVPFTGGVAPGALLDGYNS